MVMIRVKIWQIEKDVSPSLFDNGHLWKAQSQIL